MSINAGLRERPSFASGVSATSGVSAAYGVSAASTSLLVKSDGKSNAERNVKRSESENPEDGTVWTESAIDKR